ncbi:MAG: FAD:protein FMN transferase [Oscillospiraceae bacterium]|nr:FAD:protein FMN transferase [Oscillospiraceae bacterium]
MVLLAAAGTVLYTFYHKHNNYTSTFFSLDTVVCIQSDSNIINESKTEIQRINNIFDIYSPSSDAYILNKNKTLNQCPDIISAVKQTFALNDNFGPAVDITSGKINLLWHNETENGRIPENSDIQKALEYRGSENVSIGEDGEITLSCGISLDFGAVAKGYALDRLYNMYTDQDIHNAVVSFGSSVLLYSIDKDKTFDVSVRSDHDTIAGTVTVNPCFVSSSGDYERYTEIDNVRYHHIIDLSTGFPTDTGLKSVTVFSDAGLKSDFLSTMIFIDGVSSVSKYLSSPDFDVVATDNDGNIYVSQGITLKKS